MDEPGEPLIRVMALRALAYCERLFYLEEVEEIRVADAAVFAGRRLHEELHQAEKESGEWTSLEMASPTLGLIGKVDCLRRVDGTVIPYEHKRGRARQEGKQPSAWPSDALQVAAYAMLLEEVTGRSVTQAKIRYHADKATVTVPVDDSAKQRVIDAVNRARELRKSIERPPVPANDRLCLRCSLAPVCLPEEERAAIDEEWQPVRLFPKNREAKTIHVVEPGTYVGRSGNALRVASQGVPERLFPINEVGALVLHGYPQITTQALHFCASNDIPVHFVSAGGRYVCGISSDTRGVQRRLRQYQALTDSQTRLRLARKLVMAKVETGLRYVLRATRGPQRDASAVPDAVQTLRSCLKQMAHTGDPDALRGYEGLAGRAYFSALPAVLRSEVPESMRFVKRSRRPPRDRFNGLLGFGYALVYQVVYQAVLTVGLEPSIGFFHTPRSSAYPLVLDLMELFRVPLCDMVVIGSVNRLQWDPEADFSEAGGRVWLSDAGRRKAIRLFEKRLEETWKHPVIGYSLSYARLVELEVRLLEKEWCGEPGLFARMRLR